MEMEGQLNQSLWADNRVDKIDESVDLSYGL